MILEHEPIQAQPYRPPGPPRRPPVPPGRRRRIGVALAILALALVAVGVWQLLEQVHPVAFETRPADAVVALEGSHLEIGGRFLLWPGAYRARVTADGYHPRTVDFEAGGEVPDTVQVALDPLEGRLRVRATPKVEGDVRLGEHEGRLGEVLEDLPPGVWPLEVRATGFELHRQEVAIEGRGGLTEVEVALVKVVLPARLAIASDPEGADILIDGRWRGQAPKTLELAPEQEVEVTLQLPGHQPDTQTLSLKPGAQVHAATLTPRTGRVDLRPTPANATVRIDGQVELRRQLRLPQTAHSVEVSAEGYLAQTHVVVPHPEAPMRLVVALQSESAAAQARRHQHEKELELNFVRFQPRESLEIATTRRRIAVRLSRPFAVLDREVSNALYRRYQAGHDSGEAQGARLNRPDQPVVRVDWTQAALFANWMSEQAGVAPFYRVRDGAIEGFDAESTGYRLPSEAEWMWLSRSGDRYAWGGELPPPAASVNLADASAAEQVAVVLQGYNDGQTVSAPVASFAPSARGLYDLPGNVAEWVHDVFLERLRLSGRAEAVRVNPLGEASGAYHVIRGFGWRDAGRKELSLSNRRYGAEGRDDVGFRLAYYLAAP